MSSGLPSLETTPIPGLLVVRLDRRDDDRGFFKENWQREKMLAIGLPDFGPVQNNVSFNADRGVTRGIHTEPWDKFVSLATGRIFGAWVDMREGASFGASFTLEMDTSVAVFVPRGVGNSYQTLEDATSYTYLVNEHWRPGIAYPALALDDPSAAIAWPIPLAEAIISEKDQNNPTLDPATAIPPKKTLVLGGGGQLGLALAAAFPGSEAVTRAELDVTDAEAVGAWPWHEYAVVLNAAAYTAVDAAETPEGRVAAWAANATAPATLARLAGRHGFTLVHFSSEYVFDGTAPLDPGHTEDEPLSPLGVYAQTKAAGDVAEGERGEVIFCGPHLMREYHRDPERTADAVIDGWIHSGDIAVRNPEGFLSIVDRKKNLIIRGGQNIAPTDIENVLYQYAGVLEAAVVGAPDPTWGERIVAVVAPADGVQLDPEEVRRFCEQSGLVRFKQPEEVRLAESLPKNAVGKIDKAAVRKMFLDGERAV